MSLSTYVASPQIRSGVGCDHPYIPVDIMEEAVTRHYSTAVSVPAEFQAHIRANITKAAQANNNLTATMRSKLEQCLTKLDTKESYFLDLAADEG